MYRSNTHSPPFLTHPPFFTHVLNGLYVSPVSSARVFNFRFTPFKYSLVPNTVAMLNAINTNMIINATRYVGRSLSRKKYGDTTFPIWPMTLTAAPPAAFSRAWR